MTSYRRRWSRVDWLALVLATLLGGFCGWRAIPFGVEAVARRTARMRERATRPSAVDCRPVSIRLTASSDVLQTVYTLNAFLENWRGELVMAVRGWDGTLGCPPTPAPQWTIDPPEALVVQTYFPNYAEFYPQTGVREGRDYEVAVVFKLEDGQVLRARKTLHIPPRRSLQGELARKILEGR